VKIGQKLRSARENAGLTQTELAAKAGVSLRSVGRFENDRGNITSRNLEQIAVALKLPISYFANEQHSKIGAILTEHNPDLSNRMLEEGKNDQKSQDRVSKSSGRDFIDMPYYALSRYDSERRRARSSLIRLDRGTLSSLFYFVGDTDGRLLTDADSDDMSPLIDIGDRLIINATARRLWCGHLCALKLDERAMIRFVDYAPSECVAKAKGREKRFTEGGEDLGDIVALFGAAASCEPIVIRESELWSVDDKAGKRGEIFGVVEAVAKRFIRPFSAALFAKIYGRRSL
jgi:transcriptional regulator with XRE-family HTH domain